MRGGIICFLVLIYFQTVFLSILATPKYGVGFTTIPVRFGSINHTIASWLLQSISPSKILVFIPETYRDYSESKSISHYDRVSADVADYFPLESERVHVRSLSNDCGPATKLTGILRYYKDYDIDYWIVSDDDVYYANTTLSRYHNHLLSSESKNGGKHKILTHYRKDRRLAIKLSSNKLKSKLIPHVQGVDTFLLGAVDLEYLSQIQAPLSHEAFTYILSYYHVVCPLSYYQDDYVISFMIYLSGLRVVSLWNGEKVAGHVDGVSTSNAQMHWHPQLFEREEQTKRCISDTSLYVEKLALNYASNNNLSAADTHKYFSNRNYILQEL